MDWNGRRYFRTLLFTLIKHPYQQQPPCLHCVSRVTLRQTKKSLNTPRRKVMLKSKLLLLQCVDNIFEVKL